MQKPQHQPLISAQALLARPPSAQTKLVMIDTRFDLADGDAGSLAYAQGHIPGAHYLHLDHDLSSRKTGRNGRHPLPDRAAFARLIGELGIGPTTSVVVYDDQGGMFAVRAWWLLRWLGHGDVAVLDGGWSAWLAAGGAPSLDVPLRDLLAPAYPASAEPAMPTLSADQLQARLGQFALIDARAGERFRGEVEPLDTRAGHIPGAVQRFFKDNLGPDGCFKNAAQLRSEFEALLAAAPSGPIVHQCGSGVTACHNLLAMEVAGLGLTQLYPGSWSEWSSDPARPIATGP